MNSKPEVNITDAIHQTNNTLLALANVLSKVAPELTKGYLGMAIHACRQANSGDHLPTEIFQKCFPGAPLPIALSPEDFAKKVQEAQESSRT